MRYLLSAIGVVSVVAMCVLQTSASNFSGAVTFIVGDTSACSTSISDSFANLDNWTDLSGTWTNAASNIHSVAAGVSIYTNEQTCTVTQWAMAQFDLPGSGMYAGLYLRSQNDATTYAYAVRYEQPANRFVWRYCGGADHSNDPDSCTTIDSGAANWSRTLDDLDFVGVEVTGTGTGTEVKIYDLGATAKNYSNWASSSDASTTLTNDPDRDAATGKYLGVYNGAAQTAAFDDFSGGSN